MTVRRLSHAVLTCALVLQSRNGLAHASELRTKLAAVLEEERIAAKELADVRAAVDATRKELLLVRNFQLRAERMHMLARLTSALGPHGTS